MRQRPKRSAQTGFAGQMHRDFGAPSRKMQGRGERRAVPAHQTLHHRSRQGRLGQSRVGGPGRDAVARGREARGGLGLAILAGRMEEGAARPHMGCDEPGQADGVSVGTVHGAQARPFRPFRGAGADGEDRCLGKTGRGERRGGVGTRQDQPIEPAGGRGPVARRDPQHGRH